MAKFMFIYRNSEEVESMVPTPEQIQELMTVWGEWMQGAASHGAEFHGGDGLQPGGKLIDDKGLVSDGPYVESKEVVGGYNVLEAESYEVAIAIAKDCPVLQQGGNVEIRELAGLG
ncbi:MAG: YciI family protein [Planctomycetota bacterium]